MVAYQRWSLRGVPLYSQNDRPYRFGLERSHFCEVVPLLQELAYDVTLLVGGGQKLSLPPRSYGFDFHSVLYCRVDQYELRMRIKSTRELQNGKPRSANRGVRTAECEPRSANRGVRTAECEPRSTNRGVRTAEFERRSANYELRTTNWKPRSEREIRLTNEWEPRSTNREREIRLTNEWEPRRTNREPPSANREL